LLYAGASKNDGVDARLLRLDCDRNDGVIERLVFLGMMVLLTLTSGSEVRRILAGIDSSRDDICCWSWSSERFFGLGRGAATTSTSSKTGASTDIVEVSEIENVGLEGEPKEFGFDAVSMEGGELDGLSRDGNTLSFDREVLGDCSLLSRNSSLPTLGVVFDEVRLSPQTVITVGASDEELCGRRASRRPIEDL
jgi:hypothetical protein